MNDLDTESGFWRCCGISRQNSGQNDGSTVGVDSKPIVRLHIGGYQNEYDEN